MDTLESLLSMVRVYLQPITTSFPPAIRDPLTSLLTNECYTLLVEQIDPFTNPQCLKLAISKAIGVAIITFSAVVKVPQLLKLLKSKSSAGVSFLSYLLETSAYLITLAYNFRSGFPFSTFGETALIAIQNVIIAVLVLNFTPGKSGLWPAMFVAGLATAGYALFNEDLVDMERLRLLQTFVTIPLGLMSKIPQIKEIYQQGGTGQLSAFAVFNYLFGSLARVFTTLTEVDDPIILYGFLGSVFLNTVLAIQMVYYWNSSPKKTISERKMETQVKKPTEHATPQKAPSYTAVSASGTGSPGKKSGGRRKA